jgi:hypothetical protein
MGPAEGKFPVPILFPFPGLAKEHLHRAFRSGNNFLSGSDQNPVETHQTNAPSRGWCKDGGQAASLPVLTMLMRDRAVT